MHRFLLSALIIFVFVVCATHSVALFKDPEAPQVRALKFEPAKQDFYIEFGGKNMLEEFESQAKVAKALGVKAAKALTDQMDFEKEKLVLVSWNTSGPPEGKLMHELVMKGGEKRIVFFVKAPANVLIRGQRARIGADFFAVPRHATLAFEATERK